MIVNNLDKIDDLCSFDDETYYKFVVLVRQKDKPKIDLLGKERKEQIVKQWLVQDKKYLESSIPDMLTLVDVYGGRLYMTLDKKSYKKTLFELQRQCMCLVEEFVNNSTQSHTKKLNKLISSVTSKKVSSCSNDKKFMLDVDTKDMQIVNSLIDKQKEHHVATLETKNGFHVIFNRKFNPNSLEIEKYPDVEIKTNSLVLLAM